MDSAITPAVGARSKNMLLRIHLVRHGETKWSRSGQHTGRSDIPLTAHGEDQARDLGQHLRSIPFARVLTSPRQRAQRTCELAALNPVAEIESDLVEWDYGDYEGKSSAEILAVRPDWNLFRDGCPNGESPTQVSHRANRLIARLRALDENIALFTHGHFGRVLGVRWIGWPVIAAQHLLLRTASLSILGYEHDRTGQPVITLWNATSQDLYCPGTESRASDGRPLNQRAIQRCENIGGEIPPAQRNFPGM